MKRDFHKEVRVVYRACRILYGIDIVQTECMKIFKVVFPELYRLEHSDEQSGFVPNEVRRSLELITRQWHSYGKLAELIRKVETWYAMPFENDRNELIQFYRDITPIAIKLRSLTPRECFRLMGVLDERIDTVMSCGISKASLYDLAGNSIVAGTGNKDSNGNYDGVLFHVFRKMFIDTGVDKTRDHPIQLTLF